MDNFKITIEDFEKVKSDNITRKEYKDIISKIDDRFNYIIRNVMSKRTSWWDYLNGRGETDGYFDPECYEKNYNISLDGDFNIPEPYNYTDFPIRWLWEDFEEEFKSDVENFKKKQELKKQKAKETREKLKVKKVEMKSLIQSKLTKEELTFITFK